MLRYSQHGRADITLWQGGLQRLGALAGDLGAPLDDLLKALQGLEMLQARIADAGVPEDEGFELTQAPQVRKAGVCDPGASESIGSINTLFRAVPRLVNAKSLVTQRYEGPMSLTASPKSCPLSAQNPID
jgi:hypothetical protein